MKLLYFFSFLIISSFTFSQTTVSLSLSLQMAEKYTQQDSQEQTIPVMIQGSAQDIIAYLELIGAEYQYSIGDIHSATLTPNQILQLANQSFTSRIDGGIQGYLLNENMRNNNNVIPLHEGSNGLDKAYKGEGVIVGILDTGLDYRHPDFFDDEGNNRVIAIWDQNRSGTPPDGFTYGMECDSLSIAAGTCSSMDSSSLPHGTHVAAVATGYDKDFDGEFTGMAPASKIIAVGLDFTNFGNAVVDGSKYVFDMAKKRNMPAVINLSAGTYFSSHDGNDVFTKALEELLDEENGRAFTHAAGNGGNTFLHLGYEVTEEPQFTYFRHNNSINTTRFFLYADSLDFSTIEFQLQADDRITFEEQVKSRFYNANEFASSTVAPFELVDTLVNDANEIIGIATMNTEYFNGVYSVLIGVRQTNNNTLWRFTTKGSGRFDVYSWHQFGTSRMVRKSELPASFPELESYKEPDFEQNIVGLFNASDYVISVGNYHNTLQWIDVRNIARSIGGEPGDIRSSSSRGPTRDGRIKPDVSAPGHLSGAAYGLNRLQVLVNSNNSRVLHTGMHYLSSGTSNSAPSVAGGIALLFEQYPNMSWKDVKESVTRNAKQDNFTSNDVNNTWGYGKYDAFTSFTNYYKEGCMTPEAENYDPEANVEDGSCIILGCINPNSFNYSPIANTDDGTCVTPKEGESHFFQITPNPLVETSTITIGFPIDTDKYSIEIYDSRGRLLWEKEFVEYINVLEINRSDIAWASQVCYVILRKGSQVIDTQPLVIQ